MANRALHKLVEQDKADLLISPLWGSEGVAVKDFAKSHPEITVINAASGAQETTYVSPAANFFRFNIDAAQMSKGLGEYIYTVKKYKKIVTIGEDYSFGYTQVFGLVLDYCGLGGDVTQRLWVPLGTKGFGSIMAALPDDIDAIYVGLGGGDALNFLTQYQQAGGKASIVGGSMMVDQTVLSSRGKVKAALLGVPSSGPQADASEDPRWQAFVRAYQGYVPARKPVFQPLGDGDLLLHEHQSGTDRAQSSRWRPERRQQEIPGGAK